MKENEKQAIEEMAAVIERTEQIARDAHCGLPSPTMYAKDLYWHGYRRLPKTTEAYQGQLQNDITECYGCDPMYYGTDGAFLAENLVKNGMEKAD